MINKIKYLYAVAILVIAAAFSACGTDKDKNGELVTLEDYDSLDAGVKESVDEGRAADNAEESAASASAQSEGEDNSKALAFENTDTAGEKDSQDKDDVYLYVYVCGAVNCPNVYALKSGARIVEAVEAAGGSTDEAACEYLNLAEACSDGQKIYVPTYAEIKEAEENGSISGGLWTATGQDIAASNISNGISNNNSSDNSVNNSDSSGSKLVNINTADANELMTLPGIGQSKADKIIAYRQENGDFAAIEDIMLITGIKEGLFGKIKDYICVQ